MLNAIAEEMLTVEFVERLHNAMRNIANSLLLQVDYGDSDLARDLAVPLPVARILMSFVGASAAEREMTAILARGGFPHNSEASH